MRRIGLCWVIVAGALAVAGPASAGWGEDWGTMVWGAAATPVPTLGLLGFGLLSLALAAGAVFTLRRRAWTMSVLLVALAIPLAAAASPITGLNVFSNGTTADAAEVNANFDAVAAAVNDNDSRITAVEADTAAAQSTADTAVTDAATAQSTADAAAAGHTVDTTLDETAVDHFVANNGYATGAHTVDTTLDEAAVDAFVANNGYAAATVQGPHDRPGLANTALGVDALLNNGPNGDYNTANGYSALESNTTGNWNTASGKGALYSNTDGTSNTAIGGSSLYSNTTGNWNTASGNQALYSNAEGSWNTASGFWALYSNTTGSYNTANGANALNFNTEGGFNTASGNQALRFNTTGTGNTASGHNALYSNTEGSWNTASGILALNNNTTGDFNTASGRNALFMNTTGEGNIALGYRAGYMNTTGEGNIALGYRAGYDTTGSNNILVGNEGFAGEDGTIRIGTSGTHTETHLVGNLNLTSFLKQDVESQLYDVWIQGGAQEAAGDARNLAILGRTDTDTLVLNYQSEYANGTRIESGLEVTGCINGSFCSDARLKVEIAPLGKPVLEEVLQLEAATYRWKDDRGQGTQIGLIAQEVEKVFPEVVATGSDGGQKGLSCTGLNAVTIQAIQELKQQKDAEIAALKAEQAAIRGEMEQRLARLESHDRIRLASNDVERATRK